MASRRPHVQRCRRAVPRPAGGCRVPGVHPLAGRPCVPSLWRGRAQAVQAPAQDAATLEVRRLPQAVHGHGRHDLRGIAHRPAQVAARLLLALFEQEGHERPTSFTGCSASPIRAPGSWRTGFVTRWSSRPFTARLTGTVEVDETYVGGKKRAEHGSASRDKQARSAYGRGAEQGSGRDACSSGTAIARSFRMANVTGDELKGRDSRSRRFVGAHLSTDSFPSYRGLGRDFAGHETVNHAADE